MDISLTNRLAGWHVPALAVMVLALLGAGCAEQPQQAGQAAVQPANVAITALAASGGANDETPLECDYLVPAGTAVHQWNCFVVGQARPAAAADDDPLECQYVVPNGTMIHKWVCVSASEIAVRRQRSRRGITLSVDD